MVSADGVNGMLKCRYKYFSVKGILILSLLLTMK